MAQQKGLLERVGDRLAAIYIAAEDKLVQLRRGSHEKRLAEILKRVEELPGGKDMLALAQSQGVVISVVAPRNIDKAKGRFSRGSDGKRVRVSNNGDPALMTTTLWHELRHVQQHVERGDMAGKTTRLYDTRMQHTIALMHEADAFTMQALMALRQKKAGNPEYLEHLLTRRSLPAQVTNRFIKEHDFAEMDEAQYMRALFTEVMLAGMAGYNRKYFAGYGASFEKAADLKAFRKMLDKTSAPPDFDARSSLTNVYGEKYMSATSIRAVAESFIHAQPQEVYDTLKLIEETTAKAKTLTEQEFKQARDEILKQTKSLSVAFNTAAAKLKPEVVKLLREAANANQPLVRERGRGVSVS